MKILRFPIDSAPWASNIFGQTTVFSFGEKEISMAVLFEAPDDENYHLSGLEKAWEAATTTAFIHRQLTAEELIEKVLTAINTAIKESSILLEGAVFLTEGLRVHFSTTGQTGVLLIDENSISLVSSSQKSTEFTAVTSGDVDTTDNVLLAPSFLVDQLTNQSKISFGQLEELCRNEKTLVIAAVQDQSPLLSNNEEEVVSKKARPNIPISSAVGKISGLTGGAVAAFSKIKLPKFKFKLPKTFKFKLPPFQISSLAKPLNIIGLLILLVGIYYGSTVVRQRISAAKQAEQPSVTILDKFRETTAGNTDAFLSNTFEFPQYKQLSDEQKTQFQTLLTERGYKPITTIVKQELPEKVVDAGKIGELYYLIDSTGQLWKYDSSSLQKIEQSGLLIDPLRLLIFKEDRILVTDATGNIWLFDGSPIQPISLPLPQSLSIGKKLLAKYNSNLYIYSAETKHISRIAGFDRDIINPSLYSKVESTGLSDLQDLVISGDALGLDNTGKLQVFSRSVAAIGQALVSPPTTGRLYAIENGWVHLDKRIVTTFPTDLSTKKFGFILTQDEPTLAIFVEENLTNIVTGNKLLTVNN